MRRRALAAQRRRQQNQRDQPITAVSPDAKTLRGTKRVCQACDVRFYDLSRDPIVCPSCGAHYVPTGLPVAAEAAVRGARFTDKTGWRGKSFKRPEPVPDVDGASEGTPTDDANDEALSPGPNDDVGLEEEPDETDISTLLDHHDEEPKER